MSKRLTQEEFIQKVKEIHGDKFDYSETKFKKMHELVSITCPKHGLFKQIAISHLQGHGCAKCSGRKKLTQKEFTEKARKIHSDKFDYSYTVYKNATTKVKIFCKNHGGIFEQRAGEHLAGHGCDECSRSAKYTQEKFINKSKTIHNNIYGYEDTEYKLCNLPVKILCKKHGIFEQTPHCHMSGQGCPKCAKNAKDDLNSFLTKARKVHGNDYEYSKTQYINTFKEIDIICPKHGLFSQKPNSHLMGRGCPHCGIERPARTTEEYIIEARKIHGDYYDYSKTKYTHGHSKVGIICRTHGKFSLKAYKHLAGQGCRKCNISHGERRIEKFLTNIGFIFERERRFETCKNINPLPFDFYIEGIGCIEFHGEQHYKCRYWFGCKEKKQLDALLKAQQHRDKIKEDWCKKNKIPLLIIPYTKYNKIETLMKNFIETVSNGEA